MNENGLVDQEQLPLRKQPPQSLITITRIVYILHALSIIIGVATGCSIATAFVFGWPSIIAVIINYVKRKQAEGTYIATHFVWQIRTFWWAVIWIILTWVLTFALAFMVVGVVIPYIGFAAIGIWVCYRIVKGWLRLSDGLPMNNGPISLAANKSADSK